LPLHNRNYGIWVASAGRLLESQEDRRKKRPKVENKTRKLTEGRQRIKKHHTCTERKNSYQEWHMKK